MILESVMGQPVALFLSLSFNHVAMKILLLILFLHSTPHPDTIDNWQVYQNKKLLIAYNAWNANKPLIIKKAQIKPTDVLSVQYARDTPCSDCVTSLSIKNNNNTEIKLIKNKGTFTPFNLLLSDLTKLKNNGVYLFYRSETGIGGNHDRLLFKLIVQ
jgi:hypothetical protein